MLVNKIEPIGLEINKLMADKSYLDKTMLKGKDRAIVVADSVLSSVYETIGFKISQKSP